MNWLGFAAIILGFFAFAFGIRLAGKKFKPGIEILLISVAAGLTFPAIAYAVYYSKLLGEPIWLYRIRTLTGTELLASPAGLLAGWMHVRLMPHLRVSRYGSKLLMPALLATCLSLPYLKPLLRPLPTRNIPDQWRGAACIQSTPSTCGPASAATILKAMGQNVPEKELAAASFTSASGTENWYLARALRRCGMKTSFQFGNPFDAPLPAIVGVKLRDENHSGHFIALLDRDGDNWIMSDPMDGLSTNSISELQSLYEFTGFCLSIQPVASLK